jgi:anti-anti-sigma regulatory factor
MKAAGGKKKKMMRVTPYKEIGSMTLKVEGELVGIQVAELKRCWNETAGSNGDEKIRLDLSEVTYTDDAGKDLLALMHRAGVELIAVDVLMKSIVDEIKHPQYDSANDINE